MKRMEIIKQINQNYKCHLVYKIVIDFYNWMKEYFTEINNIQRRNLFAIQNKNNNSNALCLK